MRRFAERSHEQVFVATLYDPALTRGQNLIVSLVMATVGAGLGLSWYGYKATLRIQTWGENMNDQDHILLQITEPEETAEFMRGYRAADADARFSPALVPNTLSLGRPF